MSHATDNRPSSPIRNGNGNRQLSGTSMLLMVAGREISTKMRDKTFLISTVVILALIVGSLGIQIAIQSGGDSYTVGVVDAPDGLSDALKSQAKLSDADMTVREYDDEAAAKAAVEDESADAAVIGSDRLITKETLDTSLGAIVQTAHRSVASVQQLEAAGLDPSQVSSALDVPPLQVTSLDPDAERNQMRVVVAIVGVAFLYGLMIMFGQIVAQGVVEEKSSRVVEVLLATLRPWQLLAGKVLGLGVLGFAQMVLVVAIGVGGAIGFDLVDAPGDVIGIAIQVLLWFILGYTFFATAFAVAASLVTRQEDLPSVITPMMTLLIGGFVLAITAGQQPEKPLALITSLVPGLSPMVLPIRAAGMDVPLWQIVVAIVLQVAAIVGLIRLGGRIYAGALLRTGGKVKVKEALRNADA